MAEDTIDRSAIIAGLPYVKSNTECLHIHGYSSRIRSYDFLGVYGTDADLILELIEKRPELKEKIHPDYPIIKGQVVWAIHNEDAKTIEDFLARRSRLLFLDAKASIACAEGVAEIFKQELNLSDEWKQQEILRFTKLAKQYLLVK